MSADKRGGTVKVALVLVVTFVLGAVAGAGLSRWGHHALGPPPPGGGPIPIHELDLSPSQHEQVREILARHRPEVEAVLGDTRPQIDEINQRVVAEVRQVLTDEQNRRFDEIRSRPGPPGHRPPGPHPPPGPPGPHPPPGPPP